MYRLDEFHQYRDRPGKAPERPGKVPRLPARQSGKVGPGVRLRMVAAPGGVAFVEDEPAIERS